VCAGADRTATPRMGRLDEVATTWGVHASGRRVESLEVGVALREENVGEVERKDLGHDPASRSSFSLPRLAPTADFSFEVASPPTSLRTPDGWSSTRLVTLVPPATGSKT
jgi:hypothetical protein